MSGTETDFSSIGKLVTKFQEVLDTIKGGAIRKMETEFTGLKQLFSADSSQLIADVDTRGRGKLSELDAELARIKQNVDIQALGGQGRYVTEITVNGDKDTFYPVVFKMPRDGETEVQIYRHYAWNSSASVDVGDFDTLHVAGALVVLRGQAYAWDGNANYLRTIVNYQRYRQTVANIGFLGYCHVGKNDPVGPDTDFNRASEGYVGYSHSGFMLRGGKLKYRIISNKPIDFRLLNNGEVIGTHAATNVKWTARTVPLDSAKTGDGDNNHSMTYIGY